MMKRLILALMILGSGTVAAFVLKNESSRLTQQLSEARAHLENETAALARANAKHAEIASRVKGLKEKISTIALTFSAKQNALMLAEATENDWDDLPGDVYASFLAEAGLNWFSSNDYIIVSKKTLTEIGFPKALEQDGFNEAIGGVLAITPDQRAQLNATLQSVLGERKAWLREHVQRIEPAGDIAAHYIIPPQIELYRGWSNVVASAATDSLGTQRAGFFMDYIRWGLTERGVVLQPLFDQGRHPDTLVVRWEKADKTKRLIWEFERSTGGSMRTTVSRWQFPEQFRDLFPNGWPDVAAREGFELPKGFHRD